MSYSTLIVGLGKIGLGYDISDPSDENIRTHARAFHLHQKFILVAGVDPSLQARELFEENYECKAYSDLRSALHELKPDVVVVATPTEQHLTDIEMIVAVSSPKAILCEKPLSYNGDDGKKILDLCNAKNIDVYVNYIRRADPAVIEIKARLEAREIETPLKGVAWYSKGLLHNGSHFVDLLTYWLGDTLSIAVLDQGEPLGFGDFQTDVIIEFEGGSIVFLATDDTSFPHSAIELISPSGRLNYGQGGLSIIWHSAMNDDAQRGEVIQSELSKYQLHAADHLANALENKPNNLCSGQQALKTVACICKINKAS